MAEVRCPMCGKPNPEDLEVCQFCQARLKPLILKPTPPEEPNTPEESGGDWLQDLRGKEPAGGETAGSEETTGETGQAESDEAAAWLDRIRERKETDGVPPTLASWVEEGISEESGGGDDLSWLEGIRGKSEEGEEAAPAAQEASESEGADWLERIRARQDDEIQPDGETAGQAPGREEGETPDWPAGISAEAGETADEAARPDEGGAALPGWLSEAAPETAGAAEEPALPAEELPDWMSDVSGGEAGEKAAEAGGEEPASETPDWLAGLAAPEESAGAAPLEAAGESAFSAAETPDWLAGLGAAAGEETGELPAAGEPAEPALPSQAAWEASTEGIAETPVQGEEMPALEGEVPEWLKNIRARKDEESGQGEPAPFMEGEAPAEEGASAAGADVPDWLEQIEPDEGKAAPAEEPPAPLEGTGGLAPAELPSWVQAMRPVETAAPHIPSEGEGEERVENAGPLAGLQGILPSEPIGEISKPPVFSIKLQVNERQRVQATLLESLLGSEAEVQAPRAERAVSAPQRALRWIIAVLMLAAVFYPVVTGSQVVPLPQLFPVETVAENDLINALPSGAPVLVAVDYQPALSGEMQASSAAVLQSLMERGARLAFISTSPNGPALAQSLLDGALARDSALQSQYGPGSQNVVNMGYLAGGAAGLADFALRPQTTQVYALDMTPAWNHPALQGVSSLSDFAQVLVITDSADTGRAWVEQVQPVLGSTPMALVVSAQSAPLMLPYYESGQVKGMVSGVVGGAAFEQITQRPSLARQYWDPFQAGIIVAVLLILIGGVVNGGMLLIAERKEDSGVSS